jgi:hypothetical protein
MAKKVPLPPVSSEIREELVRAIQSSREPLPAKSLAVLLAPGHSVTEAQLTPVLDEYVAAATLRKYAPPKGKPKYWDRDLRELTREAVLQAIQHATSPLTAKEVVTKIAPPKIAEVDVTAILDDAVAAQRCFIIPSSKVGGKPSYWHTDLRTIARDAIQKAALEAAEPFTAKDLASRVQVPVKLSEAEIGPVLDELVTTKVLHSIPPKTAKGKPQYWRHDVLELGRRVVAQTIHTKGPQTQVNLRKALKSFNDSQFHEIVSTMRANGSLTAHPPLGATKQELLGTRPPSAALYLKDIGTQLKKVVGLLTAAHVSTDELRRTAVQLLSEAGIPLGSGSGSSDAPDARPTTVAETVDLMGVMKRIEPGAERGALVGARELRNAVRMPKAEFDHAIMELARQGQLSLHRHDYATSLSQQERDELVTDGNGTFYVGMAFRPR